MDHAQLFSPHGALQLKAGQYSMLCVYVCVCVCVRVCMYGYIDMGAVTYLFKRFTARPENFLKRIKESVLLLTMPARDARRLHATLSDPQVLCLCLCLCLRLCLCPIASVSFFPFHPPKLTRLH